MAGKRRWFFQQKRTSWQQTLVAREWECEAVTETLSGKSVPLSLPLSFCPLHFTGNWSGCLLQDKEEKMTFGRKIQQPTERATERQRPIFIWGSMLLNKMPSFWLLARLVCSMTFICSMPIYPERNLSILHMLMYAELLINPPTRGKSLLEKKTFLNREDPCQLSVLSNLIFYS